MTLGPGVLVNQNVRLARLLGHGGMGSIWVADHLTLRTQVAVKFILADYTTDPEALERFSREASSSARIKSPHVVQVFDHGIFAGSPYIVMELLQGEDLAACIARGPLGLGELVPILQQIGKALAHAHALGIVHRDIKPANVYLTTAGEELLVKLLDFGVAKMTRSDDPHYKQTQTGQLVGTPCFMSPEQIFSRGAIDHRADLWALGVLVYEAVVGALPFGGNTIGDVYLAVNSGDFKAPTSVDRVFPSALDGWFKRAFARDPAARFGSAREMVEAFTAIAARSPGVRRVVSARAPVDVSSSMITEPLGVRHGTFGGLVSTGSRRRKRRSRFAIAGGAVATIAVAGALALVGRTPAVTVTAATQPAGDGASATAKVLPSSTTAFAGGAAAPDGSTAPVVSPMAASAAPVPTSSATAPRRSKAAPTARPAASSTEPGAPVKHDHGF